MTSLTRRAVLGAGLWTVAVFVIGTAALVLILDRIALAQFEAILEERLLQVTVALNYGAPYDEALVAFLVDPAYDRPYSGRYWQVTSSTGLTFASDSLFDLQLTPPAVGPGDTEAWRGTGPAGSIRGIAQGVTLEDGTRWTVTVAESERFLAEQRRTALRGATVTFTFLGVLAIAGAAALVSVVLKPLRQLSEDVALRWTEQSKLTPEAYPTEVAPLVSDINALLDRNTEILARSRRQTADLAHALKTPAAALRNELFALREAGATTGKAEEMLARIDRQVSRSLARMRAANSAGEVRARTNLARSVRRLERLFSAMPRERPIRLSTSIGDGLSVAMNEQDFEETLGNLMDNAFKWAASEIRVEARSDGDWAVVLVADDGPGISADDRARLPAPGFRLDTEKEGTGLGLAIAEDLVSAYGGTLGLEESPLGGFAAVLRIPKARRLHETDA
jgi:signal transduction histidine kinase